VKGDDWMAKSDFEILEQYIDATNDREFVESLTSVERLLYKCELRNTIQFSVFLMNTRMRELGDAIAEAFRKVGV
jgi:hypothetical protein